MSDSELPSNLQRGTPPGKSVRRVAPQIKAKTWRILLEENSDIPPTGLFLGHNGNTYMLRPGEWADVPYPLVEILDNAVTQVPVVDPQTKQVTGWRSRLRFPYRTAPGQGDREAA
jgi:hypothetical protein